MGLEDQGFMITPHLRMVSTKIRMLSKMGVGGGSRPHPLRSTDAVLQIAGKCLSLIGVHSPTPSHSQSAGRGGEIPTKHIITNGCSHHHPHYQHHSGKSTLQSAWRPQLNFLFCLKRYESTPSPLGACPNLVWNTAQLCPCSGKFRSKWNKYR